MSEWPRESPQFYQIRALAALAGICIIALFIVTLLHFIESKIPVIFGIPVAILLFMWSNVNFEKAKRSKKLNLNRLKESTDNDVNILQELYNAFQESIKERLPLLENALKNNDQDNAVLYSHDFKGSSATIGLEEVRQTALTMEMHARAGDLKSAAKYFPKLCRELEEGTKLLQEYIRFQKRVQQQNGSTPSRRIT